jgi:Uma2 family endonuclease
MYATKSSAVEASAIDQRVHLHDVSWQAYEALVAWRGESAVPRLTYLEGELELMTPSTDHEMQKTMLARLVEAFADAMDISLDGAGSWTVKHREAERGAEADECYILGSAKTRPAAPDIAIEVVWTRGGIDKLEVWRKLGAREVWIWSHGTLAFHVLHGERYQLAKRSKLLPKLDPELVVRCMACDTQREVVRMLRAALKVKRRV